MYECVLLAAGDGEAFDIVATIISTVVATIISSIVAWFVSVKSIRASERIELHNMVTKLIDYAMQYPYVENQEFCRSWPDVDALTEDKMRYDFYCCYVFNVLERTWKFHRGDENLVRDFIYCDELIETHQTWWRTEHDNLKAYDVEFRNFVDNTIGNLK